MSELGSVIDQLAAVDLALLPDVELTDELLTLRSQIDQLEAQWTRRVGAAHRRGTYDADGAVSMGAWLQQRCRLAPGAARDRVNAAHRLDELPETVAAFAAGEIGWAHVQVIAGVATDDRRGQVIACESILVDAARQVDPRTLRRVVAHLRAAVDPEAARDAGHVAHERRRLTVAPTFDGAVHVEGLLDAEGGATVIAALEPLMAPTGIEDGRSRPQRCADALVDLARARLADDTLPDVAGDRPHLSVVTPYATLRGDLHAAAAELDTGDPICHESLRRLACDCTLTRVITDGASQILDVGHTTRTIPRAVRRALRIRDRGCVFPGCSRPFSWTDAHHVIHWADDGPTALHNLVSLCRRHHRRVHEDGWTVDLRPDGSVWFTAPWGGYPQIHTPRPATLAAAGLTARASPD